MVLIQFGAYYFLGFVSVATKGPSYFLMNHLYRAGITNRVNTVANGFCTSDPVPDANKKGISPNAVVTAVINTGLLLNTRL